MYYAEVKNIATGVWDSFDDVTFITVRKSGRLILHRIGGIASYPNKQWSNLSAADNCPMSIRCKMTVQ